MIVFFNKSKNLDILIKTSHIQKEGHFWFGGYVKDKYIL